MPKRKASVVQQSNAKRSRDDENKEGHKKTKNGKTTSSVRSKAKATTSKPPKAVKSPASTKVPKKPRSDAPKTNKPPKFSWVIDKVLGGMGRPTKPGHMRFLVQNKVRYLVTLTINKPTAVREFGECGIEWVHIPIQDETPPSVSQIQMFVDTVNKARKESVAVAVHCAWGRGRTGTMLASYLLTDDKKLTAEGAISKIRELRPGSIDTEQQANAVKSYYQHIKKTKK